MSKESDNIIKILGGSIFVSKLVNILGNLKKRLKNYSKTSFTISSSARLEKIVHADPVRFFSIIVVAVSLSDIISSLLNDHPKPNKGLLPAFKYISLLSGLLCLFSRISLKKLISTSLFFKWLSKSQKTKLEG